MKVVLTTKMHDTSKNRLTTIWQYNLLFGEILVNEVETWDIDAILLFKRRELFKKYILDRAQTDMKFSLAYC